MRAEIILYIFFFFDTNSQRILKKAHSSKDGREQSQDRTAISEKILAKSPTPGGGATYKMIISIPVFTSALPALHNVEES